MLPWSRLRPPGSTQIRRGNAALKCQQIKRWRFTPGHDRAAGVRVAAVVGLMVEQMQEYVRELLIVRLALGGAVRDFFGKIGFGQTCDEIA